MRGERVAGGNVNRLSARPAREVLDDHLRLRATGDLEADLARNVSPRIVILTRSGVWRGHEGVREQATALARYTDHETFDYESIVVEADFGYLEWTAGEPHGPQIRDGADAYVIRHGWIVAQTIHYTVRDGHANGVSRWPAHRLPN